ncbi:MAG: hypothetical protein CMI08_05710 [Oceanospirillaceae bacterium]|uniref:ATP-binding cassette domain-containing protein n=1 Tax=unclassified Thalassolituus TaxID=2624967 RepID=UPI000C504F58|nr:MULTISPECIES: ATP-binding cassette domain-containing protein [unclassified Thalassolituus]MAS25875.1 hypothetical protein [Oceanospirillaceae bacterium]MAX98694.1 hypothetical protein [Oceanospirillaceae bacterium]MBS52366.1 hypothetical protein [Oceanospirillaceae bacterium]|tara:strand:+ start:6823 stop:7512 length:690 start_codon:yes stop_codon:yes gene_type:complete
MTTENDRQILALKDVRFGWKQQNLLHIPELSLSSGESLFITGPSGCGKSTLLKLITGLLTADSGAVIVNDHDLSQLSASARDRLRGQTMGVISQTLNLLPYLTTEENLQLMQHFAGQSNNPSWQQQLLEQLNLTDQRKQIVSNLSTGQQQRAAIARALVHRPPLIIADEPTSALDDDNKDAFMKLLMSEVKQLNSTLIMVSHDLSLQPYFTHTVHLPRINSEQNGASVC